MKSLRRTFLKGAGAAGTVAAALAAGLLKPGQVLAAEWNKSAFEARGIADSLKGVGGGAAVDSKDIVIDAPEVADNGALVDVKVTSKIPGTESITIMVEKNDRPLIGVFNFLNGAEGFVATRIKMKETSDVKILVKAGGKIYTAKKKVVTTLGGCGS